MELPALALLVPLPALAELLLPALEALAGLLLLLLLLLLQPASAIPAAAARAMNALGLDIVIRIVAVLSLGVHSGFKGGQFERAVVAYSLRR